MGFFGPHIAYTFETNDEKVAKYYDNAFLIDNFETFRCNGIPTQVCFAYYDTYYASDSNFYLVIPTNTEIHEYIHQIESVFKNIDIKILRNNTVYTKKVPVAYPSGWNRYKLENSINKPEGSGHAFEVEDMPLFSVKASPDYTERSKYFLYYTLGCFIRCLSVEEFSGCSIVSRVTEGVLKLNILTYINNINTWLCDQGRTGHSFCDDVLTEDIILLLDNPDLVNNAWKGSENPPHKAYYFDSFEYKKRFSQTKAINKLINYSNLPPKKVEIIPEVKPIKKRVRKVAIKVE